MESNNSSKDLALELLRADTEEEVVRILKRQGYWDDSKLWRLYGDKEGNYAQAGNQQSLPEAALVEKLINSVDSRLTSECLIRGIDPESHQAPTNIRDAVAMFFENRRSQNKEAGTLVNWTDAQRTHESRSITVTATGDRPRQGHKSKRMCITVADQGEGQSPRRIPTTILSLNAKNKQNIRFVQGKFNMGGSGVLRFCRSGLQLVITRRHPKLAAHERDKDPTVDMWAVTIVRREEPSSEIGTPVHSEFTYLAPEGADKSPRHGEVLSFSARTFPLMPKHDEPYVREVDWGTAIKLYEYETTVSQSNILYPDCLLFAIERLLPEVALPIRLHECRGYRGVKERSFETAVSGLVVRLEEGKGDNLEEGFPKSVLIQAAGMKLTGRLYAFKEERAATYVRDEGVIFEINGQSHGYLPKSIFTRRAVGLPRLKDSVLVLLDCSTLTVVQREDLFMTSRDRLSKNPIRYELEAEIERMLREHKDLRRLQQERRESDVDAKLSEERPLEDVLNKLLSSSPTLEALFLRGQRLTRPFAKGGGHGTGDDSGDKETAPPFVGRRHPTYFKVRGVEYGTTYKRNCELGRRCRVTFVTDVEDEYLERATDPGKFDLEFVDSDPNSTPPSCSISLESGEAVLNMSLPMDAKAGEVIRYRTVVKDSTLTNPFVNDIYLTIVEQQDRESGTNRTKKAEKGGSGDDQSQRGISLPKVIPVKTNDKHWIKHSFTPHTSCYVISDPVDENGEARFEHTFYINVDNTALKTEMKYSKQDSRLLEAKFKYANVLIGIAMLHEASTNSANGKSKSNQKAPRSESKETISVEDKIREFSAAVAPILLPMIDQLAGLEEAELEVFGSTGEDD